jgi:hypothetical protein
MCTAFGDKLLQLASRQGTRSTYFPVQHELTVVKRSLQTRDALRIRITHVAEQCAQPRSLFPREAGLRPRPARQERAQCAHGWVRKDRELGGEDDRSREQRYSTSTVQWQGEGTQRKNKAKGNGHVCGVVGVRAWPRSFHALIDRRRRRPVSVSPALVGSTKEAGGKE